MQEHPLLAAFLQLVADFFGNDDNRNDDRKEALSRVALALLQGQDPSTIRDTFLLERIQYYHTQYLTAQDREWCNILLHDVAQNQPAPQTSVFMREMPLRASYLRSSIPAWAMGAKLAESIPLLNRDGRRFWIDVYPVLSQVRPVHFSGATRPCLFLGPDTPLVIQRATVSSVTIEEGTIWIQARLFSDAADEGLYCPVRVARARLRFSTAARFSHDQFTPTAGSRITLTVWLKTPEIPAGDNQSAHGGDARDALYLFPEEFQMVITRANGQLNSVAPAAWRLYSDERRFEWPQTASTVNAVLSSISIPMRTDGDTFAPMGTISQVCGPWGNAEVPEAAWLLPMAVQGPLLHAQGCGTLSIQVDEGLKTYCNGLTEPDNVNPATLRIKRGWITGNPFQVQIVGLDVATPYARQEWLLWEDVATKANMLLMEYSQKLPLIFQSNADGTEGVVSVGNCSTSTNRPVGTDGRAFNFKAKAVFMARAFSAEGDYALLYDENVLTDNMQAFNMAAAPGFESRALALNNALMTVSPVAAFLLSGYLGSYSWAFSHGSYLLAFGLAGYMPTLPDPYAANIGAFNWMAGHDGQEGRIPLSAFQQRLLVGALTWKITEKPKTAFIFGDLLSALPNQRLPLNPLLSLEAARGSQVVAGLVRNHRAEVRRFLHTNIENHNELPDYGYEASLFRGRHIPYRNQPLFSLLDVSTAADWMGVNVGFMNERFIFNRTFEISTEQNALSADGMDVVAAGRFVRLFTVPQISWEPVMNDTPPSLWANDPPAGLLTFKDDGPPTLIGNTGGKPVPIAPLPLVNYVTENYKQNPDFKAWSLLTLPFGMLGLARYNQTIQIGNTPPRPGAQIDVLRINFGPDIKAGLQITTTGYEHPQGNRNFEGMTQQLFNLHGAHGLPVDRSILGRTVTDIFNDEFGLDNGELKKRGIPVERYDFSGYGANIFSHWLNDQAKIAEVSQAKFDVWRGRTAHEIIQVRSIIYPWAIRVVRTITMFRNAAGMVHRIDSGWRAESDGVYAFRNTATINGADIREDFSFHPGLVRGVFNVRNIIETDEFSPFEDTWTKTSGFYVDPNDGMPKSIPPNQTLEVELIPVYFDADVQIEGVIQGATDGRVPSKRMLGYLQKSPRGILIAPYHFRDLLNLQNGLGGPVDCVVNIGESGQLMRITRVEVQPSEEAGNIVFVSAAKGTPILPKDGSWSVVQHRKSTGEVLPVSNNVVPLIQRGLQMFTGEGVPIPLHTNSPLELANATDLFTANLENRTTQFAFLQNTDTQKVLFRNPYFEKSKKALLSSAPDLADAYRLLNSKGIFPKLDGANPLPRLNLSEFNMNVIDEGYKLLNNVDPNKILEQVLPEGPVYFINEKDVKVYVEYAPKDIHGVKKGDGTAHFDLDSAARKWANKINDITIVVDLLDMKRLFLIRGKMDTEKGSTPAFKTPELEFGPALKPVYDILQILALLGDGQYGDALKKGLKVAMSNSPNNWEYKFQADKEIPLLKFPPPVADNPAAPLRLECFLKLGCYFNVGMPLPPAGLPMPSGGAFIEFGAKLSVMCVSVAVGTVYAVGTCTLRISADTVRGPGLALKAGFGVELMVGLPVIGNVSVYFAVGIDISIDTRVIVAGAFVLFRGRAELLAGLVTIQILIEASGKISRQLAAGPTECIAQVTFSVDISIFLIIDISFTKKFEERREIA